jgi:hypothetical protein
MSMPTESAKQLSAQHQRALQWFSDNAGAEITWPRALEDGTIVATKAKGIYKPQWSEYALSVREMSGGPYPDREPIFRADGSWTYAYFQELSDPRRRDEAYTNRGLLACLRDGVPVGVMRQTGSRPTYHVMGLALVTEWRDGYFILEGLKNPHTQLVSTHDATHQRAVGEALANETTTFDPSSIEDDRERVLRQAIARRGQPEFRRKLIEAYEGRCAVTGCAERATLDAAHISPYRGKESNHVANGLLLRSDIHNLFDLGLLAIDPDTLTVIISPVVSEPQYTALGGTLLAEPRLEAARPSKQALQQHRMWSRI